MSPAELPRVDRAQVVVIGGGIIGCSIAYHLTKRGVSDVVIIEQGTLTVGHDLARGRARDPAQVHP